jgi:hypothetical protein
MSCNEADITPLHEKTSYINYLQKEQTAFHDPGEGSGR